MSVYTLVRTLLLRAPTLCLIAALTGLGLEWTIADRIPYLATLYYALRMPVVAGALVLTGAHALLHERFRYALLAGVLVAACAATQRAHAFVERSGSGVVGSAGPGAREIRVLLWNVQGGSRGWDGIADELAACRPDVVCLVEPERRHGDGIARIEARLRGFSVLAVERKFVVFVRGSVTQDAEPLAAGNSVMVAVSVSVDGLGLKLICIDVGSNPLRPRGPTLGRLARLAEPFNDGPALLLGDFNTPRRSVHFDAVRRRWRHAFESAGEGPDVTWPDLLPVLSLDHVWVSPEIEVGRCEILRSHASDHFPVLVTVTVK